MFHMSIKLLIWYLQDNSHNLSIKKYQFQVSTIIGRYFIIVLIYYITILFKVSNVKSQNSKKRGWGSWSQ